MTDSHDAYAVARQQLLDAQAAMPGPFRQEDGEDLPAEVQAVLDAETELRAAEVPIAAELEAAWEAAQIHYREAKAAIAVARQEQARVEVASGMAARRRSRSHPVLTDEEKALVQSAREAVDVAKQRADEAAAAVKAGVTAEQLAEVS